MSKGRLSVLLVFTLVLVSTQCAVFCTLERCNDGGTASTPSPAGDPPCHHHDAPRASRRLRRPALTILLFKPASRRLL
jgi:hypothetical protein